MSSASSRNLDDANDQPRTPPLESRVLPSPLLDPHSPRLLTLWLRTHTRANGAAPSRNSIAVNCALLTRTVTTFTTIGYRQQPLTCTGGAWSQHRACRRIPAHTDSDAETDSSENLLLLLP